MRTVLILASFLLAVQSVPAQMRLDSAASKVEHPVKKQIRNDVTAYVKGMTGRYHTPYALTELRVHFVDLTGDSHKDALVVVNYDFNNTFAKELWVYEYIGGRFVRKISRVIGGQEWDPTYAGFVKGEITFTVAVHLKTDKPCCSTGMGFARYRYEKSQIELVEKGMAEPHPAGGDADSTKSDSTKK